MAPAKQEAGQHPYRCMWCGHRYEEFYDPRAPLVERSCPACRSNSVRRLKPRPGGRQLEQERDGAAHE